MNIDAILQRIEDDARQSAAQALDAARDRAAELQARAESDRAQDRDETLRQAEAQAAELRDRMIRMAALDARKEALAAKRELIDMAFAEALSAMRAMKPQQAKDFHIRLLLDSAEGGEKLIIAQEDEALFDADFFARANAAMEQAGKRGALSLSGEHRPLGGGFVLQQGGMEINCAYDSVLRTQRAALEAEVAAALFD